MRVLCFFWQIRVRNGLEYNKNGQLKQHGSLACIIFGVWGGWWSRGAIRGGGAGVGGWEVSHLRVAGVVWTPEARTQQPTRFGSWRRSRW
jgi:hypothetical protein